MKRTHPTELLKEPARALFRALGYYPAKIAGVRFKGDPYHVGFWRLISRGRWEPHTLDILTEFLTPDSIYVDVGAWIGPLALHAAGRSRQVYCIEPDPAAYQCLLLNILQNRVRNVIPFNVALGAGKGLRHMAVAEGRLGNTKTSLILPPACEDHIDVCCIRWSDWLELSGVSKIDLLKIDIEGGEFELLPTMRDYLESARPILCLSLHAPLLPLGERKAALDQVMATLSMYGRCFDEQRRRVSPGEAADASMSAYTSYLFME